MIDYGVDPDAPIFPFVIPTLLFRPVRFLWKPACNTLAYTSSLLFHAFSGDKTANGDPAKPTRAPTVVQDFARSTFAGTVQSSWVGTATARTWEAAVDAVDEVGSMWDDEFI